MRTGFALVHVVASEPHFVDHLAPIWQALPEHVRGNFYCGSPERRNELALIRAREYHGIRAKPGYLPSGSRGLCLVGAVGDLSKARSNSPRMRFAFTEHGCGITYEGGGASYIGSTKRPNVDLILVPNLLSKRIQDRATPEIEVISIGSSPRLDPWAPGQPSREQALNRSAQWDPSQPDQAMNRATIALSFHWDCKIVPETRTALPWYRKKLDLVLDGPWDVIGHGHPRAWPTLKIVYDHWGIEKVRSFDHVMQRADSYVVDNSSTLYEFAATGRPVVVLNCPRYRRDVHHGLRFWDHIPGIQCDTPEDLPGAIELALEDPPELREMREEAVAAVYPQHDGHATDRVVEALLAVWERVRVKEFSTRSPVTEYLVRDSTGEIVEAYVVEYEARTHAKKIGGSFDARTQGAALAV